MPVFLTILCPPRFLVMVTTACLLIQYERESWYSVWVRPAHEAVLMIRPPGPVMENFLKFKFEPFYTFTPICFAEFLFK